jgi:hypothetical protein
MSKGAKLCGIRKIFAASATTLAPLSAIFRGSEKSVDSDQGKRFIML